MSRPRWAVIAGQELRTQLGGPLFWVLLLIILAAVSTLNPLAMIRGGAEEVEGARAFANSMHALAPTFAMSAFFGFPFFVAMIAGLTVLRDDEAGIGDLLHSTPLTPREYVWGKFLGAAGAGGIALLVQLLVVITFRELGIGGIARGPFALSNYVVPVLWFALPGVIATMGVAFTVGTRTRRPMAVYAIPVLLLTLTFFLFWNWRPDTIPVWLDRTLMVLDPTGLRWLSHQLFVEDRGFAYYNATPIAFDGVIAIGRLVVIAVPLLLVEWTARDFGRRLRGAHGTERATLVMAHPQAARFGSLGELLATPVVPGLLRGTGVILAAELRELSRRQSLYLFLGFLMAVVHEAGQSDADPYGATPIVTAGVFATTTLPVVTLLGAFFLLFLVIEVLYRDQATRFDSIGYGMPISTGAMLAGRGLAVSVVVAAIVSSCVIVGMLVQQGGPRGTEIGPLLLVYGAVLVPTFVLWSSFVAAAMTLTRSRTAALAAGLAALLITGAAFLSGSLTWVSNWPLWLSLPWSESGTFPLNGEALWLNRLLALALACALAIVTRLGFRRIEPDQSRSRQRRAQRLVSGTLRLAPALALAVVVATFLTIRIETGSLAPVRMTRAVRPDSVTLLHSELSITLDPPSHGLGVEGVYLLQTAHGDTVPHRFAYDARYPGGYTRNGGGAEGYVLPEGVSLSTHRGDFLPPPGSRKQSDRFTANVTVRVPSAYRVAVSGTPVGETDDGQIRTTVWRTTAPVTALSLHAGQWIVSRDGDLSVQLFPAHRQYAEPLLAAMRTATTTYTEWFGPLEWRTLQLTEAPAISRDATSYPGSITMPEDLVMRTPGLNGSLQFDVVAHEVAHQWWGHHVVAGEGPGSGWLIEGLADYSMLALISHDHGTLYAAATARRLEQEYRDGRDAARERSILESDESTAMGQVVLQKRGALVLWMVGEQFGQDRLHAGLSAFAARGGQTEPATPQELIAALRGAVSDTARFDRFVATWIAGTAPLKLELLTR